VIVAGLLMHAANLGGSHYAQYMGMSAGITALVLATQPLVTAFVAAFLMGERLRGYQWLGVLVGCSAWRWWSGTRSTCARSAAARSQRCSSR
jgi:drug/metabolite transporter (DMT)-like permease